MRILQVSMLGNVGGAARIAWDLRDAYQYRGHRSMLAVGFLAPNELSEDIFRIDNERFRSRWSRSLYALPTFMRARGIRGSQIVRNLVLPIAQPQRFRQRRQGIEDFDYPATARLNDMAPQRPEIINCHNLHDGYFDLRALEKLSSQTPAVLTLHDMWLLTGHCAHAMECMRWQEGCGQCPDLNRYPSVARDATRFNWRQKRSIYASSHLYVISVSHWMMRNVERSMLEPADYQVIPNGVDLRVFHPSNALQARRDLGLPEDAFVVLFAGAYAQSSVYKDYSTAQRAAQLMAPHVNSGQLVFVNLGGRSDKVTVEGNLQTYSYKYRSAPQDVARFYWAADLFLHAANADTFPATVLESLACGTPVVATAVGGIPEQIDHGVTGFLVPKGDADTMAQRSLDLIRNSLLRRSLAHNSAVQAQKRFDFERQVSEYLDFYERAIQEHTRWRSAKAT
jgi:glycosyltransferase involved in cell wall biosynthesis